MRKLSPASKSLQDCLPLYRAVYQKALYLYISPYKKKTLILILILKRRFTRPRVLFKRVCYAYARVQSQKKDRSQVREHLRTAWMRIYAADWNLPLPVRGLREL